MLKLDIQLFGGRGASSGTKKTEIGKQKYQNKYNEYRVEIGKYYGFAQTEKSKELGKELRNIEKEYNLKGRDVIEIQQNYELSKNNAKTQEHIPTFTGGKNLDKALDNGYMFYRRDDLRSGGRNYKEIANRLKAEGYKVRVFEDTTRVRGLHNYSVLYKRGK